MCEHAYMYQWFNSFIITRLRIIYHQIYWISLIYIVRSYLIKRNTDIWDNEEEEELGGSMVWGRRIGLVETKRKRGKVHHGRMDKTTQPQ